MGCLAFGVVSIQRGEHFALDETALILHDVTTCRLFSMILHLQTHKHTMLACVYAIDKGDRMKGMIYKGLITGNSSKQANKKIIWQ